MDTMKKGRISKKEESYIKENLEAGHEKLAGDLNRDPDSVLEFIRRKVVSGDFKNPSWLDAHDPEKQAEYELTIRPYWNELKSNSQMKNYSFSNTTGQGWFLNLKMMSHLQKKCR